MNKLFIVICILCLAILGMSSNLQRIVEFNTDWISTQPEVLTYRTKDNYGDGLYQVSVSKGEDFIEVYTNIITNNFSKSVWGKISMDMRPIQSISKIIIGQQIIMDTKCFYQDNQLNIETTMKPYNKISKSSIAYEKYMIDFSQTSFIVRTIPFEIGKQYSFNSIDPQSNKLVPLSIVVLAEESIHDIECYKVELNTFEGKSINWIEKADQHRIIRIEQSDQNRVSTLIF